MPLPRRIMRFLYRSPKNKGVITKDDTFIYYKAELRD